VTANSKTPVFNDTEHYTHWLETRLQHWRTISNAAKGTRADRSLEQSREVMDGYRALARDLSVARRKVPNSTVHRALEALYTQTHNALNAQPRNPLLEAWHWFSVSLPTSMRILRSEVTFVTVLFAVTTIGVCCHLA